MWPSGRPALVKLFAGIVIKGAGGQSCLVAPVEEVDVQVEDAPFLAVEMAVEGSGDKQVLTFRTNVDDVVAVGKEHPMRFCRQDPTGGLKPYILVRGRLEALVTRAVYVELVALAVSQTEGGAIGIWSGGIWWEMV